MVSQLVIPATARPAAPACPAATARLDPAGKSNGLALTEFNDKLWEEFNRRWQLMGELIDIFSRYIFLICYIALLLTVGLTLGIE